MVIVQITLEDQPEKTRFEVKLDILKREDATKEEFALALILEEKYKKLIDLLAKSINAKVTTKEIKGK
ncbi:MAG: hypothetical protein IPJ03_16165 [Ignavibacteriales bacterium]|nr:hypothetical protein [Ignavibacteriales bacterium]